MEDKVYVEVDAKFTPDGQLRPLVVTWEDGAGAKAVCKWGRPDTGK